MNVSEEHRLIWVPFPSTGERALADFFSKKGFFLKKNFGGHEIETLSSTNVSFSKFITIMTLFVQSTTRIGLSLTISRNFRVQIGV